MRHTRASAPAQAAAASGNGNKSNSRRSSAAQRAQLSLDSPPRLKQSHTGPSMTAERFLLILGQLNHRASELREQERTELQRGNELSVINCGAPSPPPLQIPAPQQDVSSPCARSMFAFETLLPQTAHALASPSLVPAGHQFGSPCWSNDFHALAATLGLAPAVTDTDDLGVPGGHAAQAGPQHHLHLNHHAHDSPQQPDAWPLGQQLGLFHDVEALISLPHGLLGGGGSATARAAKARLLDRFDGGGGTATAGAASNADPFCGLLACTPSADDFLVSPSWGGLAQL